MHFVKKPLRLPRNSLSLKVLMAYFIGVLLSLICIGLMIALLSAQNSKLLLSTNLMDTVEGAADELVFNSQNWPVAVIDDEDGEQNWFFFDSMSEDAAFRVISPTGDIALSSKAGEDFWPEDPELKQISNAHFEFTKHGLHVQGASATREHNGQLWVVQLAISSRFLNLVDKHIAVPFMAQGVSVFGVVLLFVFGFCAFVTLGYTLAPLRQLSQSAAAISPRSLHTRLPLDKVPAEIAPLVSNFNQVLDRLQHGFQVQQEFLATAAHELKTPLALIRAQIEVKPPSAERDMLLNDVSHMTRQVQQLLLLAEVSEPQNYQFSQVDVGAVAQEVSRYLQPMADTAEVRVQLCQSADLYWQADRAALFTLLKNLLENALQHAPPGTAVEITIGHDGLLLRDFGPGVRDDQLSQLFVRFWRGPHRRDHGAGLGLSICQEIALAHSWTLSAESAAPGLSFALRLSA
ncbi:ATP-binding protein [Rheinheimera sp.]|uniref:ATP-binding protein n=1 Tax=Rheinheimera sp. TaxID=1869214 RepID=UPI00307D71DF